MGLLTEILNTLAKVLVLPSFYYMIIMSAAPILLAALACAIALKANAINMGTEGIMTVSSLVAVLVSAKLGGAAAGGPWAGLAAAIVVGLPRNMDGTEGARADRCREFAGRVAVLSGLPVMMTDERLTTVAASRFLNATDVRGRERRKVIDSLSAEIILQDSVVSCAALGASDGIDVQGDVLQSHLLEEDINDGNDLRVDGRTLGSESLKSELVEFPVSALLHLFIAEGGYVIEKPYGGRQ